MSLNPAQQAAVEHRGGPLLVLAGAGTGKTRVITHRVAQLLDEDVFPWRILAVTFTNKAAGEMRERIEGLCEGRHETRKLWVGTFHSICARILRQYGTAVGLSSHFSIYDAADQASVMGRVLKDMNVSDKIYSPKGVLGYIDRAKNRGLGPEELGELQLVEPVRSVVAEAYTKYRDRLRAADAADFGDLLVLAVKLLRSVDGARGQLADLDPVARLRTRFSHVVVDEFQDTNPIQAELVDLLATEAQLCVVGDDDQAIYGWRGAQVDQILNFPDRHPGTEVIRLEQNYRSTGHILRCADAIISKNRSRLGKTLWSDLGDGEVVRVLGLDDERTEARLVAREIHRDIEEDGASPEDYAVFYRTHAQSRVLEDEMRRIGLRVRIVGGVAFYERMEVKDALSYLALLLNPHSDVHLLRVINRPARGLGQTSVGRLAAHAASKGGSVWSVLGDPTAAGLGTAAAKRVRAFAAMMNALRELSQDRPLDELLVEIVDATGYREMLLADGSEEAMMRLENLQELQGNILEFVEQMPEATLADYLELVSLVGGERTEGDSDGGAVTLMTIHSAKGLEYTQVYLTGMEERIFPHARVLDDPVQMEEERRLAYVAVTRAKRGLTLTLVKQRYLYGQRQVGVPSRFALDLPLSSTEQIGLRPARMSVSPTRTRPEPKRTAAAWQDDIEYDNDPDMPFDEVPETDGSDAVGLYVGMLVRHESFGEGEVVGWSGDGRNLKLRVRFAVGPKTIVARFCQPA